MDATPIVSKMTIVPSCDVKLAAEEPEDHVDTMLPLILLLL